MKILGKKVSIWRGVSDLPGASHSPSTMDLYVQINSCCAPQKASAGGRLGADLGSDPAPQPAWQTLPSQNRDLAENSGSTHITLTEDLTLEIVFDRIFLAHGAIIC